MNFIALGPPIFGLLNKTAGRGFELDCLPVQLSNLVGSTFANSLRQFRRPARELVWVTT